jgi:hypothetical protein
MPPKKHFVNKSRLVSASNERLFPPLVESPNYVCVTQLSRTRVVIWKQRNIISIYQSHGTLHLIEVSFDTNCWMCRCEEKNMKATKKLNASKSIYISISCEMLSALKRKW